MYQSLAAARGPEETLDNTYLRMSRPLLPITFTAASSSEGFHLSGWLRMLLCGFSLAQRPRIRILWAASWAFLCILGSKSECRGKDLGNTCMSACKPFMAHIHLLSWLPRKHTTPNTLRVGVGINQHSHGPWNKKRKKKESLKWMV